MFEKKIYTIYMKAIFGPILDDRLKEKFQKLWKGVHSIPSACLSVCGLQGTPFDLGT